MLFCVTAYAKPHGQGFNNYDDKVTIVFTDDDAKKWIFRYRCEVYSYLEWRRISGNFGQDYGKNRGGDCSASVHILNFELFLQITKIVTKSTQEGTEISASALFFYVAGVEISKFLSKFAPF